MSTHVVSDGVISPGTARLVLACGPLGIFSAFLWPGGADIIVAILVAIGVIVLLRARELAVQPPLVLAGIWVAFLLFAAIHASAWGAPGRPFQGLEKHLPLALGPLAAVALSVACHRLRLGLNELTTLFLAGLVAGALAMLIRNGALDLLAHGWPQVPKGSLGKLNRNYAALACGISLIAIAALIACLAVAERPGMPWRVGAIAVLTLVFAGEAILLVVLQSRTGYAATMIGLAVWCALMMRSVLRGAAARSGLAIPAVLVFIVVVAGVAYYFPLISERFSAGGSTTIYLREMYELVLGDAVDASSMSIAGAERLQLVTVALDLIRQRPWLGWGPNASQLIALFSPYPGIRDLNQFHNGYLELFVSFGVVGGILIAALLAALVWSALGRRRAASPDRLAPPLFAALIALAAYILVTNVTESIIFVKPVGIICMFLAALACMQGRTTATEVIGPK